MPRALTHLFWLEAALGAIAGLGAVVTLFWRDWIEVLFGVDPDSGSGAAEWLIVAILLLFTLVLAAGARREWRRTRARVESEV